MAVSMAFCILLSRAEPVPAKSRPVPWSTEVRRNGKPSVIFVTSSKPRAFVTGRPWSWYIAK